MVLGHMVLCTYSILSVVLYVMERIKGWKDFTVRQDLEVSCEGSIRRILNHSMFVACFKYHGCNGISFLCCNSKILVVNAVLGKLHSDRVKVDEVKP